MKKAGAVGVAQLGGCLSNTHEALGLVSITTWMEQGAIYLKSQHPAAVQTVASMATEREDSQGYLIWSLLKGCGLLAILAIH